MLPEGCEQGTHSDLHNPALPQLLSHRHETLLQVSLHVFLQTMDHITCSMSYDALPELLCRGSCQR